MLEFDIKTMSCGHCVGRVTAAIRAVDPDAEVVVDLATHSVRVRSTAERARLAAALTDAGYAPER